MARILPATLRAAKVGQTARQTRALHNAPRTKASIGDKVVWAVAMLIAVVPIGPSSSPENPKAMASGTRMSFKGLESADDRLNVIAYLRTFSDNPADIPEADPTATATDHNLDPAILALEGDPEYGEYLSSECTTCHQAGGDDDGIPSIVLWPEEDFVIAMHAYKNKDRPNPVMQMMAGRLNSEEIAALAAYFATLEE